MKLELPYPNSANRHWRTAVVAGHAQHYISPAGKAYRAAVNALTPFAAKLTGPLSVRVALFPPNRQKRDIDNCLKPLLDALTHAGVWGDDSQVKLLSVTTGEVIAGGRCVVEICSALLAPLRYEGNGQAFTVKPRRRIKPAKGQRRISFSKTR